MFVHRKCDLKFAPSCFVIFNMKEKRFSGDAYEDSLQVFVSRGELIA
jgi:hypothetical protein